LRTSYRNAANAAHDRRPQRFSRADGHTLTLCVMATGPAVAPPARRYFGEMA
jgi:hypothetical protein